MSSSLERLKHSHQVDIYWRSFELRPAGSPPIPEWYLKRIETTRPQFEAIAREHYGIIVKSGPFGINSRKALIGAKFAEAQQGPQTPYHDIVLRAYWQEALDISDSDVLRTLAIRTGLDGNEFVAALENSVYNAAVEDDVAAAHRYGLNGVPALVFKERYLVSGAQPYETLAEIVEQLRQQE